MMTLAVAAAAAGLAALVPGASLPSASWRTLLIDEDVLVVDKDAGLLTVPGRGAEKADCLLSRLQAAGHTEVLHAAHRLDRDTSGIVALGRSSAAHRALSVQFQERRVSKRYEALLLGWPDEDSGEVDASIGKVRHAGDAHARMSILPHGADGARRSLTRWRVIERGRDTSGVEWTRVDLIPVTGRAHQLCVWPSSRPFAQRSHGTLIATSRY